MHPSRWSFAAPALELACYRQFSLPDLSGQHSPTTTGTAPPLPRSSVCLGLMMMLSLTLQRLLWALLESHLAALGTEVVDLALVFIPGSSALLIYRHATPGSFTISISTSTFSLGDSSSFLLPVNQRGPRFLRIPLTDAQRFRQKK